MSYGVRYEYYPFATRDHEGVFRFDPALPAAKNVLIGGRGGVPNDTGEDVGKGLVVPRLGINYRPNEKTVIRTGFGITEDPDNFRFMRDTYPASIQQSFSAANTYLGALDPTNNNTPVNLVNGIPAAVIPDFSSGAVGLPANVSTVTVPQRFRRGYIESWNVFVQQDFGAGLVGEVGYVGTHEVRQISNLNINAAPIPSSTSESSTPCNSNLAGCNYNANRQLNLANCSGASLTCYNNTDINSATPLFSSAYSGLQAQLSRRVGRGAQFGLVYTWSKTIDFADNSNYSGLTFAYPAYWRMNRAVAGYDRTNDLQLWTVYKLPFGTGEAFLNHGVASAIFGGFQLNTRLARVSGTPFTITTNNNLNAPGNGQVADVTGPLQLSHASHAGLQENQLPYFSQSSFAGIPSGVLRFGTAGRNSVRGPGYFNLDASVFRDFHIWREANFQLRFEAFDALNTPQFQNPNANQSTGGNFGYVTNTNASRNVQLSGRINF